MAETSLCLYFIGSWQWREAFWCASIQNSQRTWHASVYLYSIHSSFKNTSFMWKQMLGHESWTSQNCRWRGARDIASLAFRTWLIVCTCMNNENVGLYCTHSTVCVYISLPGWNVAARNNVVTSVTCNTCCLPLNIKQFDCRVSFYLYRWLYWTIVFFFFCCLFIHSLSLSDVHH